MPNIDKNICAAVTDYIHSWFIYIKQKIKEYKTEKCTLCGKVKEV
jgi:hypothetical protein